MALIFKSLCDTVGRDPRNANVEKKCLYFAMCLCTTNVSENMALNYLDLKTL